eukprot:12483097-Heterocapsa_arctica.AAC.1
MFAYAESASHQSLLIRAQHQQGVSSCECESLEPRAGRCQSRRARAAGSGRRQESKRPGNMNTKRTVRV